MEGKKPKVGNRNRNSKGTNHSGDITKQDLQSNQTRILGSAHLIRAEKILFSQNSTIITERNLSKQNLSPLKAVLL